MFGGACYFQDSQTGVLGWTVWVRNVPLPFKQMTSQSLPTDACIFPLLLIAGRKRSVEKDQTLVCFNQCVHSHRLYFGQDKLFDMEMEIKCCRLLWDHVCLDSSSYNTGIHISKFYTGKNHAGLSLEGNLGEIVSLSWLISPYFQLKEKWKCIEHIRKSKIWTKTSPYS